MAFEQPSEIKWVENAAHKTIDAFIDDKRVAWIEPRPAYCDRGHWKAGCELPDIDAADGFPRYYMALWIAKLEMTTWLQWRLWRIRSS